MALFKVFLNGTFQSEIDLNINQKYLAGRSEECEIYLESFPGISRQHFLISFNQGQWQVESVSKFGKLFAENDIIEAMVLDDGAGFSVPPYSFVFQEVKNQLETVDQNRNEGHQSNLKLQEETVSGQLCVGDSTVVRSSDSEFAVLRLIDSRDGQELSAIKLEGNRWIVGRESTCDLYIDNNRISRNHFELFKTGKDYCLRDLGSSNGTIVNGTKVSSDRPLKLNSGDFISILYYQIYFEIRSIRFEQQIKQLVPISNASLGTPPSFHSHESLDENLSLEQMDYRVDLAQQYVESFKDKIRANLFQGDKKTKIIRFGAIVTLVVLFFVLVIQDQGVKTTEDSQKLIAETPLDRLTTEKKELVIRSYELAKNLYMQGNYELAFSEVNKVHNLVSEYKDSREIEEFCRQAFEIKLQQDQLKEQKLQEAKMRDKIIRVVDQCSDLVRESSVTISQVESCLSPAIELDPENEKAQELIMRVNQMEAERARSQVEKVDQKRRVERAKALFRRAQKQQKMKQLRKSLETYRSLVLSDLPDPQGIKKQAQREIASIQNDISSMIETSIRESEAAKQSGDLKRSIEILGVVKKNDPSNERINDLFIKNQLELKNKMKLAYQEAILEENMGNIAIAKEKWKKIVDEDIPIGEFSKKAKLKLKRYGGL